ncbi:MAG: hypothetical protein IJP24_05235 [Firmicutes bacterium]|nr:hypothetical protein [Bacillota bacterium]
MIKKIKNLFRENIDTTSPRPYTREVVTNEPKRVFIPLTSDELIDALNAYISENYRPPETKPIDSTTILYSIKAPSRLEIINNKLVWVKDDGTAPTFSNEVKRMMEKRGIDSTTLCSRVLMDRKLFSKLNTDVNYHPSKETAIAFCFGLQISYKEALVLLDRAGYSLSNTIPYDDVIRYLLMNRIYDIDMINEVLDHYGFKCIGTSL